MFQRSFTFDIKTFSVIKRRKTRELVNFTTFFAYLYICSEIYRMNKLDILIPEVQGYKGSV